MTKTFKTLILFNQAFLNLFYIIFIFSSQRVQVKIKRNHGNRKFIL